MLNVGIEAFLVLAERPMFILALATASSRLENTLAFLRTSIQPTASASDFTDGNSFGLTKSNFLKPIVFIALAVEPIFPGCDVLTKTI